MRIKYWYISEINSSVMDYITENDLEYKLQPQITARKSRFVVFSTFKNLEEENDSRIIGVNKLRTESVFDSSEYNNAEWFSFGCSNCILSVDVGAKAFEYSANTMHQTGYCKMNKDDYSAPIIAPKNNGTLIFCSNDFAEYCSQITDEIIFKKTVDKSGKNHTKMLQLDYVNHIGHEAFVLDSSDFLNRATIVEFDDVKKIYVRDPGIYIPTIRRDFLKDKGIVATDYIWGGGCGYRMLFCNKFFYLKISQSKYNKYFYFDPIIVQ